MTDPGAKYSQGGKAVLHIFPGHQPGWPQGIPAKTFTIFQIFPA
jgi:hypothetical protein